MTDQSETIPVVDYKAEAEKWGRYAAKLTEELQAMTKARDLSKQQTADVADREQALLRFLRDEHPETYEAWVASNAWG